MIVLAPAASFAADSEYRIGEGDVIKIEVYDHADLTSVARVSGEGVIHFPLIGQVRISGMTIPEVSQLLAEKLSDGYIVNPQISVFIEEFRSKKVTIMGQVNSPGLYELSGPTTLLELISKAEGLNREAGDYLTIRRSSPETGTGGEQMIPINLKDLLERGDTSLDIAIRDGDNVFVPKAGIIFVTGQVNRPDAYKLEKGETLIQAITMAGGFTNLASQKKVKIIRKVQGRESVLENVSMHTPILPGDVIVVPESFF